VNQVPVGYQTTCQFFTVGRKSVMNLDNRAETAWEPTVPLQNSQIPLSYRCKVTIAFILAMAMRSTPVARADYTFSTIASFSCYANGAYPYGGHLTLDAAGNLYGTASAGGEYGWGTVFQWSASAHTLTALGSFDQNNGVRSPYGGVAFDAAGNLYGTSEGILPEGFSFMWSAASHAISTYHSFGGSPAPGFVADSNGNIYGALAGGAPMSGSTPDSVFEFSPATHVFTTLGPGQK
jgi:uncharacterized repeat protein (TIGR03803 family)